ncbi:MAG: DUF1616 domain-containing protein [Acidilobus sp.]
MGDEEVVLEKLEGLGGRSYLWELEGSLGLPPDRLGRALSSLRERGLIEMRPAAAQNFQSYLLGAAGWWFWLYLLGVAIGVIGALLVPHSPPQVEFLKVVMGSPFLYYLPGYGLLKALFPERRWGSIEEAALSIVLSLSLDPIVGLGLVQTSPGLTISTTVASLAALEAVLGMAAAYRRYEVERKGLAPPRTSAFWR